MSFKTNDTPIRRRRTASREALMSRGKHNPRGAAFRNMLDNIHPHSIVEADDTEQCGEVVEVIRDRFGVPACIKVIYETEDGRWGYDYISPENITTYHPYDHACPDEDYEYFDSSYKEDE